MDIKAEIDVLEKRVREAGFPVAELLRRAKVDASRWQRWKNGSEPLASSWSRISDAADELLGREPAE